MKQWKAVQMGSEGWAVFEETGKHHMLASNLSAEDAYLMSAAPDMLDALDDIFDQAAQTHYALGPDLADSIRVIGVNAIRKAKGGKHA